MRLKIIFGIIIPLIIIIILAVLGSLKIGFNLEKDFSKEISLNNLFVDNKMKNSIKIGEIIMTNDYFLSKRQDLNYLAACLIDKENVKETVSVGNVYYSEGDYNPYNDASYYGNYKDRSVEIKSREKKIIYVYLEPDYTFRKESYAQLVDVYNDYDEIIIFEKRKYNAYSSYRNYCSDLDQETIDNSIHIIIVS